MMSAAMRESGAFLKRKAALTCSRDAVRVPELTRATDIKLNMRVSLRPIQTSLAWPAVAQIGPQFACVLRDQGPLRTLEAAPPPKTKATRVVTLHGLMPGRFRSSQDSVAAKLPTSQERSHNQEARQVELAGFLRGY